MLQAVLWSLYSQIELWCLNMTYRVVHELTPCPSHTPASTVTCLSQISRAPPALFCDVQSVQNISRSHDSLERGKCSSRVSPLPDSPTPLLCTLHHHIATAKVQSAAHLSLLLPKGQGRCLLFIAPASSTLPLRVGQQDMLEGGRVAGKG